jgi:Carboxypeptidase regulatory-like domain
MRSKYIFLIVGLLTILLLNGATALAQTGELRGHVLLKQGDGTSAPAPNAVIDVYRTDIAGVFHNKTDKNGTFSFAGLPYVGTYIIAVSMPNASPTYQSNVKVGRNVDYELVMTPGDGHALTLEAIKKMTGGGAAKTDESSGGSNISAAEKAKRDEANAKVAEANKKIQNANQVLADTFKAGNAALSAKNYDEAVKQYDLGLEADAEQPAILTNKAVALKARGVDKYNAAVQAKDDAAKTAGIEGAKADFHAAVDAANKAVEILNKEPAATDATEQQRQNANKYAAFSVRAEATRLYVVKGDPSQVDAGVTAFHDYMAVETDPAKKSKAQLDMAQMLLDSGSGDKAFAEFQKILAEKPDDPDANLGAGLALFSTGDKTKYQTAANYLQHFVDTAPEQHKFKADAKAILTELKNTENVVPEKTTPARRKRP